MRKRNGGALGAVVGIALAALGAAGASGSDGAGSDRGEAGASGAPFDSADQVMLDGTVAEGVILTSSSSKSTREKEIRAQLRYMVGQLNGIGAGAQIDNLKVVILGVEGGESATRAASGDADADDGDERVEGGEEAEAGEGEDPVGGLALKAVRYSAQVRIPWSRFVAIPASFGLVLPSRGDSSGNSAFYKAFNEACYDTDEFDVTRANFWYHYRPMRPGCPLAAASPPDPGFGGKVARIALSLKPSPENTQGKRPEYARVWEDSRLSVTIVISKYKSSSSSPEDFGIAAFNRIYQRLIQVLGPPREINEKFPGEPGAKHPYLEMEFGSVAAPIDVHLYLVSSLTGAGSSFRKRYQARTQVSDLVIYAGHAGLGSNVRELSKIGKYQPGRYQVFVIDGCDTFAYADGSLFEAHGKANPGHAPSKHLDLITNARPSYFTSMDDNAIHVVQAFVGRQLTYRQILDRFDNVQGSLVDGEADNP